MRAQSIANRTLDIVSFVISPDIIRCVRLMNSLLLNEDPVSDLTNQEQCRPKIYKKVATFISSKNASNRAKSQRYMQSEEFCNLARLRNGVETIPANIRKNYHLDKLPRGKQRGKFFFGSKIAALNFRKLFGFRKGLGNYAPNPVLA